MTRDLHAAVAYASVGSGHGIAAEAILERLEQSGIAAGPTIDALEHGRVRVSGNLLTWSFTGALAPIYDRAWHARGVKLRRGSSAATLSWFFRSLRRELIARDIGALACTHALPAIVAAEMRRHGSDMGVVAVLTDFDAHSQWPRDLDAYCVPSARAAESLISREIPEERIVVTGIPLRSEFADLAGSPNSRPGDPAHPTALIVAGASQPGPYRNVRAALPTLVPALVEAGARVQIVSGDDTGIPALLEGMPPESVEIIGRSDRMHQLMSEADLYVGKPGGLICAEALARGLPLLLIGPAWGQEGANMDALVDAGAAAATDLGGAAMLVSRLIERPGDLEKMSLAAARIARPDSARSVADIVGRVLHGREPR